MVVVMVVSDGWCGGGVVRPCAECCSYISPSGLTRERRLVMVCLSCDRDSEPSESGEGALASSIFEPTNTSTSTRDSLCISSISIKMSDVATAPVRSHSHRQSMHAARRLPARSWTRSEKSAKLSERRWRRRDANGEAADDDTRFQKYNLKAPIPDFDTATYEAHLTHADWTEAETKELLEVYHQCNGKWPVVIDHYSCNEDNTRTLEDLKQRFYSVSATLLQQATPITSMTAPEYELYETLANFNATQEVARRKLAEAHLYRNKNEVDEESVLLAELQRIVLNQATLDSEREDLRNRLDYPRGSGGGYQYSTSQALNGLWQQLLAADRLKKNNQRWRNTAADGRPMPAAPQRSDSTAQPSSAPPPAPTPSSELSRADQLRFGVVTDQEKLPSGVTFASDKISKARTAKSSVLTEKIATILQFGQVPEIVPIPTPPVIEAFDKVMAAAHLLIDLRKVKEKEEAEMLRGG